jgi:predicted amidophosphoribosyltransferase
MQKMTDYFIQQIQCPLCLRCGSFCYEKNYFCKTCTKSFLYSQLDQIERTLKQNLQTYSFINWQKSTEESLGALIYLLKTKNSRNAWAWFVEHLEARLCKIIIAHERAVLVAVPGSKTSYHTQYFSEEIQKLTGMRLIQPFEKSQIQGNQKSKSAAQRKAISFKFREEFTDELKAACRIYLIDDIITTGATLDAAAEAITKGVGQPSGLRSRMIGVTLFNRPLQLKN